MRDSIVGRYNRKAVSTAYIYMCVYVCECNRVCVCVSDLFKTGFYAFAQSDANNINDNNNNKQAVTEG